MLPLLPAAAVSQIVLDLAANDRGHRIAAARLLLAMAYEHSYNQKRLAKENGLTVRTHEGLNRNPEMVL